MVFDTIEVAVKIQSFHFLSFLWFELNGLVGRSKYNDIIIEGVVCKINFYGSAPFYK